MSKLEVNKQEVVNIYNNSTSEQKEVLKKVFGEFFDVRDRVKTFQDVCEEYRLRLCKQLNIPLSNTYWVADRIGDLLDVNCYYVIDMDSLKFVVDSGMSFDEFDEWYTKQLENYEKGRVIQ